MKNILSLCETQPNKYVIKWNSRKNFFNVSSDSANPKFFHKKRHETSKRFTTCRHIFTKMQTIFTSIWKRTFVEGNLHTVWQKIEETFPPTISVTSRRDSHVNSKMLVNNTYLARFSLSVISNNKRWKQFFDNFLTAQMHCWNISHCNLSRFYEVSLKLVHL